MTAVVRQFDNKLSKIYTSSSSEFTPDDIGVLNDKTKNFDYKDGLKKLKDLSKEGWEVVSSNIVFSNQSKHQLYHTYYFPERKT